MVGGSTTGTTMAMVPLFEDAEIPLISLAGGIVIIDPVKPFVFNDAAHRPHGLREDPFRTCRGAA